MSNEYYNEAHIFMIAMYQTTVNGWTDAAVEKFRTGDLLLGVLPDDTVVYLGNDFEAFLSEDVSRDILHELLTFCVNKSLTPGIYVSHETIKYLDHDIKGKHYNILKVLDSACIRAGVSNMYLIDAGMNKIDYETKTNFTKYVANVWIDTCYSDRVLIRDWVFKSRHQEENKNKTHLMSDLRYINYPFMCFMSRSKKTRLTFYTEAKKLGFWDNNPYMTFKHFNQQNEVGSYLHENLAESEYYRDDPEGKEILYAFRDYNSKTAPSELFYDTLRNWPQGIVGVGSPPATRSVQECFMAISAESEDRTDNYFITEKTIQPMFNLMPVIILGQCGINSFMESLGFDMFKDIVDYSRFDNIEDPILRSKEFTKTLYDSIIVDFDKFKANILLRQKEFDDRLCNNFKRMYYLKDKMKSQTIFNISNIIADDFYEAENFRLELSNV